VNGHTKTSSKLWEIGHDSYFEHIVDNSTNVLSNGPWFLMFFAPWCGHCKRMLPTWNDFADIEGNKRYLKVGIVDCENEDNNDLCGAFDVTGFPRLYYLKGDKYYRFKGERNIEKFTEFVYEGAYLQAESKDIPFHIEKTIKIIKSSFMDGVTNLIHAIFERIGLVTVPNDV
jgi:thiol-disulfide isomerase/thioredoxin